MIYQRFDSIIFDLDGTLWDASAASARAWSKTAEELGIEVVVDEAAVKKVSGLPFDHCVDVIFGSHARSVPRLRELLDASEKKEIVDSGGRIYPGMMEGVRQLNHEYKLFLVSNCQEWYLNSFFEHSGLLDAFQDSLCFGQTNRSKSANIKEIIQRNALAGPVYVGDTQWDQDAAFSAGADFIFARYGFGIIQNPSLYFDSFSDLIKILKSFH